FSTRVSYHAGSTSRGSPAPERVEVCISGLRKMMPRLPGEPGDERAGGLLISPVLFPAASKRLLLRRRNAGNAQQKIKDEGGRDEPEISVRRRQRKQCEGYPDEPFEEIVRVARVAPQSPRAGVAFALRARLERGQLRVRGDFAGQRHHPQSRAHPF